MNLWIGTSGFQYPEWKGTFYPEKMPAGKMLPFYAEHFASTEINYTFRRIPAAKTILDWSSATPERFKFSFKAPQRVTHFAKLCGCAELLQVFHEAIAGADAKLGPVLFQLPATFKKDAAALKTFLADVPGGMKAAFEFRHASWFDEEVYETLRAANAALCLAENEELLTPSIATADFGYLRLRREDYTPSQVRKWAGWIQEQQAQCVGSGVCVFQARERRPSDREIRTVVMAGGILSAVPSRLGQRSFRKA